MLPLKTLSPHRIARDSRESSCSKISIHARSRRSVFGGCPNSPSAVRRVISSRARATALSLTACVGEGSDIAPRRRRALTAPTSTGKPEMLNPSKNRVPEKARFWKLSSGSRAKSGQFYSPCPYGFFNTPKSKCNYGISLFHASTPERRVVTHTVKISRPAGPVPIYYGIYAIHPAQEVG